MNPGTIIVLMIVATVLAAIVINMIKNKRHGKTSCGCSCKGCPNSQICKCDIIKTE